MSSLMDAILKNQLRQVSFAVSFTSSAENVSGGKGLEKTRNKTLWLFFSH